MYSSDNLSPGEYGEIPGIYYDEEGDVFYLDLNLGGSSPVNTYEFKGKTNILELFIQSSGSSSPEYDGTVDVDFYETLRIKSFKFSLKDIVLSVPNYLPKGVTSLKEMFLGSNSLRGDLSTWDTSRVTNMESTFNGCDISLSDLSSWDVSKVTNMHSTFNNANLTSDLSSWDTSKVVDMYSLFMSCPLFNSNISNWNTSLVTNMGEMFWGASLFNQDISQWNVSKVTNMDYMFSDAYKFTGDISSWCVSNISTEPYSFYVEHPETVDFWPVSRRPQWGTCPDNDDSGVEGLVFSVQDINSNGTEFEVWANRADKPTNPTWYLKNLTADTIVASADGFVADGYTVADSGYILNITIPLTPNVTRYAFTEVATYAGFGYYSDNDHTEDYPPKPDYIGLLPEINLTVESFSTTMDNIEFYCDYANITVPEYLPPNMTNLDYMFDSCYLFNQDISMWDVSNVTTMVQTFYGTSLFNQDLSTWDVSNVTDMSDMFSSAISFNQDLSDWDVSNVTSMSDMFCDATSFNGDVSTWDTSNVVGMYNMFDGASVFNQDVSSWDTSSVINMYRMFRNANAFNSDISNWDTSKVTEMARMFHNATTFNQDLSQWCVSNIPTKPDTFDTAATAWILSRPVWGTCPERLPTPSL